MEKSGKEKSLAAKVQRLDAGRKLKLSWVGVQLRSVRPNHATTGIVRPALWDWSGTPSSSRHLWVCVPPP